MNNTSLKSFWPLFSHRTAIQCLSLVNKSIHEKASLFIFEYYVHIKKIVCFVE